MPVMRRVRVVRGQTWRANAADTFSAFCFASSMASSSLPSVRTRHGPDASQNAWVCVWRGASYGDGEAHDAEPQMPDLNEGFVEVLDGLDEVALPEDEVHLALVGDAHELCFHGGCRRGAFKNLAVFFLRP